MRATILFFLIFILAPAARGQDGNWAPVSHFFWGTLGGGGITPGLAGYAGLNYGHKSGFTVAVNKIASTSLCIGCEKGDEDLSQVQVLSGYRYMGPGGYLSAALGLASLSGTKQVETYPGEWLPQKVYSHAPVLEFRANPGGPIVGAGFVFNFQLGSEYPSGGIILSLELGRLRNSYAGQESRDHIRHGMGDRFQ